jgi:chaperone BCS1
MLAFIKHLLSTQNQFASGGLMLMIFGSIGVFLRSLPNELWDWIVRQTTMLITVKDEDQAFQWVKEWFLEQEFLVKVRRVDLDTTLRGRALALIPAPGRHLFWHAGRPFWVWFYRSEDTKGRSQRRVESLTFRTLGRRQEFLQRFVREIAMCHHSKVTTCLYVFDDYCWTYVQAYSPRLLDSVILKPGEKEHICEDILRFRASRDRYRRLGIPYHRGYLLYGPPGTGKTSLVSALSSHFGMAVYLVNLTEFNDRTLKSAMNDVPENSVLLFEDIDSMRVGDRREDTANRTAEAARKAAAVAQQGVTLSGLLNVLDGFHAPENVLFVMTTNHIEALDPALLRPGRIDYKLYLGEAIEWQRIELYRRFFPSAGLAEAKEFAEAHAVRTMAEFQGLLLGLDQEAELEQKPEYAEIC